MYKVIAIWQGEIREAIFLTKTNADEFASRLMAIDLSSCPRVVKI